MNIQETHKQFNLFLDKVSSESVGEISHRQIDVFLHEAEVRIVKQAYGGNNVYKQGYQEIQKRTDDLNTLVKTGYIKDSGAIDEGVYSFPLSSIYSDSNFSKLYDEPYMFFIKAMVKVKSAKVEPTYTGITLIPQDKYTEVIKDPFNKSKISSPVAFFEDNSIKIDTNKNSFAVEDLKITFLKYPKQTKWDSDLSKCINSELPEQKQREAIQLAVAIVLEGLESQRSQSQNQMLGTIE